MKSADVYKIINSNLLLPLKEKGFKKAKSGMLGYYKSLKEFELYFWFQCSRDGFDKFLGSKFIVQFGIAKEQSIPFAGIDGGRISKFMALEDFLKINSIQNSVISKLKSPPKDIFIYDENTTRWYLKKFEKITETYTNKSDIWFRYFDANDIEKWINFLNPIIFKTLSFLEEKYN